MVELVLYGRVCILNGLEVLKVVSSYIMLHTRDDNSLSVKKI